MWLASGQWEVSRSNVCHFQAWLNLYTLGGGLKTFCLLFELSDWTSTVPSFSSIWFRKLIALGLILNSHSFWISHGFLLINSFILFYFSFFKMKVGFPFYNLKQNSTSPSREEDLEVTTLLVDIQVQPERVVKGIKAHIRGWA